MWISPDENSNNNTNRLTRSPSKSTCSCSSHLSPSSPNPIPTATPHFLAKSPNSRRSMEEVWKDITLASLHGPHSTSTNLQDFLATPFHKLPRTTVDDASSADPSSGAAQIAFLGALPPPPAGILSLNNSGSEVDFRFLESNSSAGPVKPSPQSQTTLPSLVVSYDNSAIDTLRSSSAFPTNSKKRPQEDGDNSTDRRHERMIKNRESAARSRARKQEKLPFSLSLSIFILIKYCFC